MDSARLMDDEGISLLLKRSLQKMLSESTVVGYGQYVSTWERSDHIR